MKIVYIAGRYTADSFEGVSNNVTAAKVCALLLAKHRVPFYCPIIHTAHFETILRDRDPGYEFWIAMTMEMLKRCDAVWAIEGWKESKGARGEVEWARANGLPVFEEMMEVVNWYEGAE